MSAPYLLLAHPPTASLHLLTLPALALHSSAPVAVPPHAASLAGAPPLLFAAQAARATVCAFRLTQQNSLTEVAKHPAPERISALAHSPRGTFLVAGSPSGRLYAWEASTGELIRQWEGHYKKVGVVKFGTTGDIVWTGGDDGVVHGWLISDIVDRTSEAPLKALISFSDHTLPIVDICPTEGPLFASWLVTASADRTVRIRSLAPLPNPPTILTLLLPSTPTRVILPAPYLSLYIACVDGVIRRQHLYSRSSDGSAVPVTEYSTGRLDFTNLLRNTDTSFQYPITPSPVISLANHGDRLYAGHADGFLTVFDLPSGVILRRLDCATLNPNAKHDPNNEERGVSEIQVVELALKPGKREPAWGILKRFRNENPVSVVELPGPGPLVEPDMELWDGTQPSTEPDAVAELMEEVERLKKREAELVKANEALFRVARKEL